MAATAGTVVLAVKGINAERQSGTPQGLAYSAMLGTLKGDLAELEKTAAQGAGPGITAGLAKLQGIAPEVNAQLQTLGKSAGDTVDQLIAAGERPCHLRAAAREAATDVDHLAGRFVA